MIRLFISFLTFFLFFTACNGQSDYSKVIKEQAETMGQFLLKKDFGSFCKYTYPKIIGMMGGRKKMIETMDKETQKMLSEGTDFISVTLGEPSKITTIGNELQCTVPQTVEMKVPNGRLEAQSTLIAISIDKGKNWYFVDTSGKDIQTMKKILPNLSGELVIPEKTQPIFYPE